MFAYIWPIALVVISNVVYQLCTKGVPADVSPFASLTLTYLIGAVCSLLMFFVTARGENLFREFSRMNWAPYVLGLVIVGLEVGFIYAYRAGWAVSTASLVQSAFLSSALVFVGYFLYHEPLTPSKLLGVVICLVGLVFINR